MTIRKVFLKYDKGNTKPVLSEFAIAIEELIGDHSYGYINYFDSLLDTFLRAEKHLKKEAEEFMEDLKEEDDPDTAWGILQSNESLARPNLDRLYESFFITLHSELEIIWCDKVKQIYSECFSDKPIAFQKLSNNYQYLAEQRCFIDVVIAKHQILFDYNFIRNGLVHHKATGSEFFRVQKKVDDEEIKDVVIKYESSKVKFLIQNLKFGQMYSQKILALLNEFISLNP